MGMSEGEPHPMTAMKVGTGSRSRESVVMDLDSVRRYSWQFCRHNYQSTGRKPRVRGLKLTPQKKWRTKITRTLLATLGPEYKILKGRDLPSLSRTGRSATLRSISGDGMALSVSISPLNSAVLSTDFLLDAEVVYSDVFWRIANTLELCFLSGFLVTLPLLLIALSSAPTACFKIDMLINCEFVTGGLYRVILAVVETHTQIISL
jgi:hypothetical protein